MSRKSAHAARGTDRGQIAVPELLQGDWKVALILTFGADLPFFEQRLAHQLHRTPTRVVLADDVSLSDQFAAWADWGQRLPQANRTYLVSPIRNKGAAHAKAALLATEDRGLLITGSGNLSPTGYASDGELWRLHTYSDDKPEHVAEFGCLRELVDSVIERGWTDPFTQEALAHAWQQAPWIPTTGEGAAHHHNLHTPLLDALTDILDFPVEHLIAHAPFYDSGAVALRELVNRIDPKKTTVLVSPDTSADPKALRRVAPDAQFERVSVADDPKTYLHAKWIHLIGKKQEILFAGSANISQAALTLDATHGNIELAHIERRPRGGFQALYSHLNRNPVPDPSSVGVSYRQPEPTKNRTGPTLLWARLTSSTVTLRFDHPPDPTSVEIHKPGHGVLVIKKTSVVASELRLTLNDESSALAHRPGPLLVRITGPGSDDHEVPIWPYRSEELRSRMASTPADRVLARTADLPETDAELRDLLLRLEHTLLFDPISVWRTAKRATHDPDPEDESDEPVKLSDIDWAKLRRHPRFAAYGATRRSGIAPTDVQIILSAITGHLTGLGAEHGAAFARADTGDPDGDDLGPESDQVMLEDEDEDLVSRRELEDDVPADDQISLTHSASRGWSVATKTRASFTRFIRRYNRALHDPEFQQALGPVVGVENAAIFNHLMAELQKKDLVDFETCAEAQLDLWDHLWGTDGTAGLLTDLDEETLEACSHVLEQTHAKATTVEAVAHVAGFEMNLSLAARLRQTARRLLSDPTWDIEALLKRNMPSRDSAIVILEGLELATCWTTPEDVIHPVAELLGLTKHDVTWGDGLIRREGQEMTARILEVTAPVPGLDGHRARQALQIYASNDALLHPSADYWRIRFKYNHADVVFWDDHKREGLTFIAGQEAALDRSDVVEADPTWLARLKRLQDLWSRRAA